MVASAAVLQRQIADLNRQHRGLWRRLDERVPEPAERSRKTALDVAAELGIVLDPWQREALQAKRDTLLLVTRQGGKGEVASLAAMERLLNDAGSTTVVVARAERQAKRLLRRIKRLCRLLSDCPKAVVESQYALELANGAECLALPGSEETIRGIEAVDFLIIDEAALVPDDVVGAVYPMLATTDGTCIAMTTPRGKRGWFWREWTEGGDAWHRAKVTAPEIPRIKPGFLARMRKRLGDWMYRQEFLCEFLDTDDQLYATDLIQAAMSPEVPSFGLPTVGALP